MAYEHIKKLYGITPVIGARVVSEDGARGSHTMSNHSLGKAVATLREERNLTQIELATRAGLSKNGIAQIERGRFNPSIDTVRQIAAGLGLEDWQLLQFAGRINTLMATPFDGATR